MNVNASERPRRLSLSQIVEMLLARGARDRSSVTLIRTTSGETQIEVTVRTGDDEAVTTAEDAEQKALAIYDRLRAQYPNSASHDNAEVTLTRNAKGETQIAVSAKTAGGGVSDVGELVETLRDVYDKTRMAYPMADGFSAKPGSVA